MRYGLNAYAGGEARRCAALHHVEFSGDTGAGGASVSAGPAHAAIAKLTAKRSAIEPASDRPPIVKRRNFEKPGTDLSPAIATG